MRERRQRITSIFTFTLKIWCAATIAFYFPHETSLPDRDPTRRACSRCSERARTCICMPICTLFPTTKSNTSRHTLHPVVHRNSHGRKCKHRMSSRSPKVAVFMFLPGTSRKAFIRILCRASYLHHEQERKMAPSIASAWKALRWNLVNVLTYLSLGEVEGDLPYVALRIKTQKNTDAWLKGEFAYVSLSSVVRRMIEPSHSLTFTVALGYWLKFCNFSPPLSELPLQFE